MIMKSRRTLSPGPQLETLLVDRAALVKILKMSLFHLHESARVMAGTSSEIETREQILYWEAVLGWVKQRDPKEVVLTRRVPPPSVSRRNGAIP